MELQLFFEYRVPESPYIVFICDIRILKVSIDLVSEVER